MFLIYFFEFENVKENVIFILDTFKNSVKPSSFILIKVVLISYFS